ncbi:uncharacterized protein [Parasteatoda tepidariorum]|uniref:uncharacterized protein n=1 Tax=Parasteatoda tepidariorum TaxID=114398 RepID=UPI00077FAFD0|nr:uncharacterized protein LOC107439286 [Parasteatoda tepidariorum]
MPMSIIGTVAAISAATVLFVVPLVMKYHVYKPSVRPVIVGDVIKIERTISTVWCQGVFLHSEAPFQTFVYDTEPIVMEEDREKTLSSHRVVLPNRAHEYWGFHLLKGSIVELSACARLIGGDVTVVRGHNGLHQCLNEHEKHLNDENNSGEISESESDEDTSSISSSQGAVVNDTENLYVCKKSLEHRELPPSYRCSRLSPDFPTRHILSLYVEETDYYYFIFSSKTYLEIIPNEFFIQFGLERTHYDYESSFDNCSSGYECSVHPGSEQHVVVQMDRANSTLMQKELQISCEPREWFFFLFYAGFLLVIFLCAFQ